MRLGWKITHPGEGDHGSGRTYALGDWTISKEFYADGPSLFTYVIRHRGHHHAERRSLRGAKAHVATWQQMARGAGKV